MLRTDRRQPAINMTCGVRSDSLECPERGQCPGYEIAGKMVYKEYTLHVN